MRPTRSLASLTVGLMVLLLTGCGSPGAGVAQGEVSTPTLEPTWTTIPAGGKLSDGGSVNVFWPDRSSLHVSIHHYVTLEGESYVLNAERYGPPYEHGPSSVVEDLLWEVSREIVPIEYRNSPDLSSLVLHTRLKGRVLRIVWRPEGETRRSVNPESTTPFREKRDSRAVVLWGKKSWGWPDDYSVIKPFNGGVFRIVINPAADG